MDANDHGKIENGLISSKKSSFKDWWVKISRAFSSRLLEVWIVI